MKIYIYVLISLVLWGCAHKPVTSSSGISFSKSIVFKNGSMSVDGGPFKDVTCSKEGKRFGSIALEGGAHGILRCLKKVTYESPSSDDPFKDANEFEGPSTQKETRIELLTPEKNKKKEEETLLSLTYVHEGGGQGGMNDTRAWITRGKGQSVSIVVVQALSESPGHEETDKECNERNNYCHTCSYYVSGYKWDARDKILDGPALDLKFDMQRFTPPLHILPACLDPKGKWKK